MLQTSASLDNMSDLLQASAFTIAITTSATQIKRYKVGIGSRLLVELEIWSKVRLTKSLLEAANSSGPPKDLNIIQISTDIFFNWIIGFNVCHIVHHRDVGSHSAGYIDIVWLEPFDGALQNSKRAMAA